MESEESKSIATLTLPTRKKKMNKEIKKIWIAISTPFQANFFAPLIQRLRHEYEFLVTARNHDNIFSILKAKNIPYTPVGKHGGRALDGKLYAYAQGIQELLPLIKDENPDLLLTERWPEAVRVAYGFDIPAWAIFYDEREKHVNQLVFPLASKVFAPRFYAFQDLYQHGVNDPEKVVWFNGFHTCYLKDETPDEKNPYESLGASGPTLLVRPEPEFAAFFPQYKPILEKAVRQLSRQKGEWDIVVLPRSDLQAKRYLEMDVVVADTSTVRCPVAHADVTLGAAETMLMEAFVLCKPTVSAIYWNESKPVVELHKYVSHSVNLEKIVDKVEQYLQPEEQQAFSERAKLIVGTMDNPIEIIADEIRRLGSSRQRDTSLRRSKMEIMMDIIRAATYRPCRPTYIMRTANISYNELKGVIETLEQRGLIKGETTYTGKFYQTTMDGLELLKSYQGIKTKLFA